MPMDDVTPDGGAATLSPSYLERITGRLAVFGGLLALGVSMMVVASVLGRWLINAPIEGDFEFVQMATAIGVFAYLPYTQARRGHIIVDTFTSRLSPGTLARIDAFWDLVIAAMIGFCAAALVMGTLDTVRSGQTTMQLQLALWPAIALSTLLCAVAALTAVLTAIRLVAPGGSR
jgi:TRAP-type C4-dicarboxylate transport system permease small subunit